MCLGKRGKVRGRLANLQRTTLPRHSLLKYALSVFQSTISLSLLDPLLGSYRLSLYNFLHYTLHLNTSSTLVTLIYWFTLTLTFLGLLLN
jgi:hypothetical protein